MQAVGGMFEVEFRQFLTGRLQGIDGLTHRVATLEEKVESNEVEVNRLARQLQNHFVWQATDAVRLTIWDDADSTLMQEFEYEGMAATRATLLSWAKSFREEVNPMGRDWTWELENAQVRRTQFSNGPPKLDVKLTSAVAHNEICEQLGPSPARLAQHPGSMVKAGLLSLEEANRKLVLGAF